MTNYQTEQQAAELWRTIEEKIDKKIDARFKKQTGITPGVAYGSTIYNDFGQAVWGGAGAAGGALTARFFDTIITGAAINDSTTIEYIYSREHDPAGGGGTWFDANSPVRIIVPITGMFMTITRPVWSVDNQTGDRVLQIDQARSGTGYDSAKWVYPCHHTTTVGGYPSLVYRWDVVAGDEFRMYVSHNGGVNTLKCRLDTWFQQL